MRLHPSASKLRAVAVELPPAVVSVEEIEAQAGLARLGLPAGSLGEKTGLRELRSAPTGIMPSELAIPAAVRALADAEVAIDEIDALLYCGVSRDLVEPATAHRVLAALGGSDAFAVDISNACASMMDGLLVADSLVVSGRAHNVLVVGAEIGHRVRRAAAAHLQTLTAAEVLPYLACLTLGDAGAAAVVSRRQDGDGARRFHHFAQFSRSEHHELCVLPSLDAPMVTQSRALMELGEQLSPAAVAALLEATAWRHEQIACLVPHQVSVPNFRRSTTAAGFSPDRAQLVFDRLGNPAATTTILALHAAIESGRVARGDRLVLACVGSGISGVYATLEW